MHDTAFYSFPRQKYYSIPDDSYVNKYFILPQAILSDLFPGKEIPDHDYGKLQATIEDCLLKRGLQVRR